MTITPLIRKTPKTLNVRAYEVGLKGDRERRYSTVVYAISAGKAKYDRLLDLWDAWGSDGTWNAEPISFATLTCRRVGEFQPLSLRRTAVYRGVPFVRAGMTIEVGGDRGVIVGSNDSGNFDVLYTGGKHNGMTLNCHPTWMTRYFDKDGTLLADFTGKATT